MPDPEQPQPRPMSPVVAVFGGLLGAFAGDNGSLRRWLLGVGALVAGFGNHKLGLELTPTELTILAGTVVSLLGMSNGKEALLAHAEAKVAVAQVKAESGEVVS